MEWYYAKQGKQMGPVGFEELGRLAAAGELLPTDLIWKKGMEQWTAAGGVQGIFAAKSGASSGAAPEVSGAGFWIRFLARVIDLVYVVALGILAGLLGGLLLVALQAMGRLSPDWQDRIKNASAMSFLLGLAGQILYQSFCEGKHGATLGKLIVGLRVASEDLRPADLKSALIRNAAFYIDGLFLGLVGYFSMRRDAARQRFGDKWAKTVVIQSSDLPESSQRSTKQFLLALAYGSAACIGVLILGLLIKAL